MPEEFDEDLIWDTIMESAKARIDYKRFAALFPFNPDNFLSSIIYGFAMQRSVETIAANIVTQTAQTGNFVHVKELTAFIEEGRDALRTETELTAMALNQLARGAEPEAVFEQVQAGLKS